MGKSLKWPGCWSKEQVLVSKSPVSTKQEALEPSKQDGGQGRISLYLKLQSKPNRFGLSYLDSSSDHGGCQMAKPNVTRLRSEGILIGQKFTACHWTSLSEHPDMYLHHEPTYVYLNVCWYNCWWKVLPYAVPHPHLHLLVWWWWALGFEHSVSHVLGKNATGNLHFSPFYIF